MDISEKEKEHFLKKFIHGDSNECWEWLGAKLHDGYGRFGINKNIRLAHRISYLIFKGEIPKGLFVCHTCDNRGCVNPGHLWLGTNKDNLVDAKMKGRIARNFGIKNGRLKLTESQIVEIRNSNLSNKELSFMFNVHHDTIRKIRKFARRNYVN